MILVQVEKSLKASIELSAHLLVADGDSVFVTAGMTTAETMIEIKSLRLTARDLKVTILVALIARLHTAFALKANGYPVAPLTALTACTAVVQITPESIALVDASIAVVVFTITNLKTGHLR